VGHVTRSSPSCIDVAVAVTRSERDAASRLVHRCYVDRGYATPSADGRHTNPYLALPSTTVFVARAEGAIVATVSLVEDSPRGLPCGALWPSELEALRATGHRIAEVSALAVSASWRGRGLRAMRPLVRAVGVYARDLAGVDVLCVAVHPRHATFYEALLHFRRFGALTTCDAVNGAPAVGLCLDLVELDGELADPFAASLFAPEPRRDARRGLEADVRGVQRAERLKLLHSCAADGAEAVTKMC
jgi:hypothetical protein